MELGAVAAWLSYVLQSLISRTATNEGDCVAYPYERLGTRLVTVRHLRKYITALF